MNGEWSQRAIIIITFMVCISWENTLYPSILLRNKYILGHCQLVEGPTEYSKDSAIQFNPALNHKISWVRKTWDSSSTEVQRTLAGDLVR